MNVQTARRDTTDTVRSRVGPNIPAIGDAWRRVMNSLQTLRLAAEARGDIGALLTVDAVEPMIAEVKGRC